MEDLLKVFDDVVQSPQPVVNHGEVMVKSGVSKKRRRTKLSWNVNIINEVSQPLYNRLQKYTYLSKEIDDHNSLCGFFRM